MNLVEYISPNGIEANFSAEDKSQALSGLIHLFSKLQPKADLLVVQSLLAEREKLSTTGIGSGLAVPHCKSEEVDHLVILVARSPQGIDFQSLDQKPVHLIFCLIAPARENSLHLKALAKIARIAKDPQTMQAFLECRDASEIFRLLQHKDAQLD